MSFNEDYDSASQAATLALLKNIEEAAEASDKLNASARTEALKNLAEAYAWVVSPNNAH
ncbi:hypothetical protein [Streptomyces sp. GB4-14]|uniref:hypothetical protein n=1 Tax=Streptomyces sp. GB4-14 TaxID=2498703 RepID=UPI001F5E7CD5